MLPPAARSGRGFFIPHHSGGTMGRLIHGRARIRRLARLILVATVFLQFAFAAESTPDQAADVAAGSGNQDDDLTSGDSAPYSVECGQVNDAGEPFCYVDRDTYIGWRTFHGNCHVCHAQDAVGSTFAPNQLGRMRDFDFDMFVERTANGYTGQVGVMPPWKDNPNVNKKYTELFAYLKARSDGVLPPGRPKKKP
jgi:hypothetical protein